MTLGTRIAVLRKEKGMTQEALAHQLNVTNQSVSKWESGQCCPDIQLLPRIADLFSITLDALFGREVIAPEQNPPVPWEDDETLRVVLFIGRKLIDGHPARDTLTFCYEGPALNVSSQVNIQCGEVQGNVTAGGNITCDDIHGSACADGSITCDCVTGTIHAGGNITCDNVEGDASAGGNLIADTIEGNARAGGNIRCDEINGAQVTAGGGVWCDHME